MKNSPLISVIIVTFKNDTLFKKSFIKLLKTSYANVEYIIVDNNTEKHTYVDDFIKNNNFKNLRKVTKRKNMGWGNACNFGAEKAKGEYFIFLNDDIYPYNNSWLGNLINEYSLMHKKYKRLILLPFIYNERLNSDKSYYRTKLKASKFLGNFIPQNKKIITKKNLKNFSIKNYRYTGMGVFLIHKKDFDMIGGFNKLYFLYAEDLELGIRSVVCFNFDIFVTGKSILIHDHFGSVKTNFSVHKKRNFLLNQARANVLKTAFLYYSLKDIIISLPTILSYICYENFRDKNYLWFFPTAREFFDDYKELKILRKKYAKIDFNDSRYFSKEFSDIIKWIQFERKMKR